LAGFGNGIVTLQNTIWLKESIQHSALSIQSRSSYPDIQKKDVKKPNLEI
jgi:hypothetical protein